MKKNRFFLNIGIFLPGFASFWRGAMSDTMIIQLNGEEKVVSAKTLAAMVEELGLSKRMIAIERNLEVVPKSEYDTTLLAAGDRIELVHMIGGG